MLLAYNNGCGCMQCAENMTAAAKVCIEERDRQWTAAMDELMRGWQHGR
jgi:hypothetical protein